MIRTWLATLAVLVTALGVFGWATDGFSAFTAEAARRAAVLRQPRPIPPVMLEDQHGRSFTLADYRGRPLAVEFIYVRCDSVCRSLGAAFQQIRDALPTTGAGGPALLSISFDPLNDDVAALREWATQHVADSQRCCRPSARTRAMPST